MIYLSNITTSQQVYIPRQTVNTGSSQNGGCIDLEDYYTREEVDALISGITTDVTKEYVDDQDAATLQSAEAYTDQEIAAETARTESTYAKPSDIPSLDGYATEEWVEEQDYLKETDLADYAKSSAVTQEITSAITAETARTENTYAKSSAVTEEIASAIASETARTESVYAKKSEIPSLDGYATEQWVEEQGYVTENDLTDYAKTSAVTADIATAIAAETARTESTYLKDGALADYYTKTEADSKFAAESAITAETTRATAAESGLSQAISAETSARESAITQVETALSGKADSATTLSGYGITDAYTKSQVDSALAGKADTATTYTKTEVDNAITAATSGKQDKLTPGTGIEITSGNVINCTIDTTLYVVVATLPEEPAPGNENKIHLVPDPSGKTGNEYVEYIWKGNTWEELGTAYTEIDLSDYWTSAETRSAITSATSGLATTQYVDSAITAATSGLATTEYVDSAITAATSGLASTGYVDSAITSATSGLATTQYVDSAVTSATSGLATTGYVDSAITAATSGLASTGYVDNAITSATSGLQETLVSGTNIKTINNQSLLGSGNIDIQGGGGGESVVELTQAEYDALTEYAENTTYIITDATPINMDDYATTGTVNTLSGQVSTLSGTVANKADKANITARSSGYYFPRYNSQGIITGDTQVYTSSIGINGAQYTGILKGSSGNLPGIYAPTSVGTQNAILMSNGSGAAPIWSQYKFQFITQTAYDALSTKDSTCIYFIVGD